MPALALASALQRTQAVLRRRPAMGLHDDAPATAHWRADTRVLASHPNGTQIATDMPTELGGSGDQVSPGWLFRAGLAACNATVIAMVAAEQGIALQSLDVQVTSRSDTRGLLGMSGPDGTPVPAATSDLQMRVRIGAHGASAERLHALVHTACGRSPVGCALRQALAVALHIDVVAD